MLVLIIGENAYQAEQEIQGLKKTTGAEVESPDVELLSADTIASMMQSQSLFGDKRLIILRHLSEQKILWEKVATLAATIVSEVTLVLVEPKVDKRTRAYKQIVKVAKVIEVTPWTERDSGQAEAWLGKLARQASVKLTQPQLRDMVQRALVASDKPGKLHIDQFQLARAIHSLSVLDEVTDEAIATVLPAPVSDNIFDLMSFAVARDRVRVDGLLRDLRANDEPHRVFALLASQWTQLVSLALAGDDSDVVAELGIHPFVVQKTRPLVKNFSASELRELTRLAADIDARMKLSGIAPWDAVDRFVLGIALRP